MRIEQARQNTIADLEEIADASALAHEDDYFEKCLQEQKEGKRLVFIIYAGDAPAGYCILNFQPLYQPFRTLDIPAIQDLNVAPDYRRQGLARALVQHCEDVARDASFTTVGISVGLHSGFGAAQRLYVKLGYIPDGAGVTYDRVPVGRMEMRPVDDNLCLMLTKKL